MGYLPSVASVTSSTGPMTREKWARFWLLGNPDAPRPTDAELAPFVDVVVRRLTTEKPSLILTGPNALVEKDMTFFDQAVGAYVAEMVAPTELGASLIDRRTLVAREIRIGPVTHKLAAASVVPPAQRVGEYDAAGAEALSLISVLRVSRPARPLFALAGRRRNSR